MKINEETRRQFTYDLRMLCSSLFLENTDWKKKSQDIIKMLDYFMQNKSQEDLNEILGGKFPFANSMAAEKTEIPLYLYMELVADIIEKMYHNDVRYGDLSPLIDKFREYREKTIKYSNDKRFDPEKHLSEGLLKDIINSRGFIELGTTRVGDRIVVSIVCTETHEDVRIRRDGEYEPLGHRDYRHKYPCLYQEDTLEYKEIKRKEAKEIRERFARVTGPYFKDGVMPTSPYDFDDMLIEREINPDIKRILRIICEYRLDFPEGSKGEFEWMKECQRYLNGIEKLEKEEKERIEQESKEEKKKPEEPSKSVSSEEERKLAIKAARKRYASQNPLIRWYKEITGQQQRFDAIEFEDLSIEEINGLFVDSGKSRK